MAKSGSTESTETAWDADFRAMFGQRMKRARDHQKISQRELVIRLETDQSKVSRWENGEAAPMSTMLRRIALAIPTSADFLLGLTDDPRPLSQRGEDRSAERISEAVDRARGATPPPPEPQP